MAVKVSIQGYEGSFHQEAAQQYFGKEVEVIPCDTFREVIKKASSKRETSGGVMAIENSIAGSILPNYTLLQKSNLSIVGEVYLSIEQQLMVFPGVTLDDIKEVHSHPMALLQCTDFLEKHNWKLVETEDTALSAKRLAQKKNSHVAAIASRLAADLFQLEIIAPNIHTQKNNYTRFLILQREEITHKDANKASINFTTNHTQGSLAQVLVRIADAGVNLSKLQSMPIAGTNFRYSFHADMEFTSLQQFKDVLKQLKKVTQDIKVYGIYKNGNIH